MPVTQLALLLSEGTVTPQQLAAAFKDRLQRYDGLLNTAVTVTSALANSQAAAAAAQSALQRSSNSSGAVHSLLAGVPYGLKDLFSVPGYPTTWGLSALRNRTIDTVRAVTPCKCSLYALIQG
jgi:Asp-tRNA(Asn)/Glu-tRNA(Gln) amidotransferase A subunit family amidase